MQTYSWESSASIFTFEELRKNELFLNKFSIQTLRGLVKFVRQHSSKDKTYKSYIRETASLPGLNNDVVKPFACK